MNTLLITLLFLLLPCCNGRLCDLYGVPVIAVTRNETDGTFVVVNNTTDNDLGNLRRRTTYSTGLQSMYPNIDHRHLQTDEFYVRKCWCSFSEENPLYCPLEFDQCRVDGVFNPDTNSFEMTSELCLSSFTKSAVVRFSWPVALFLFASLALVLFRSDQGASARFYMYKHCCICNGGQEAKDEAVEREMNRLLEINPRWMIKLYRNAQRRQEPNERRRQRREHIHRQMVLERRQRRIPAVPRRNPQPEPLPPPPPVVIAPPVAQLPTPSMVPTELVLKTRVYRTTSPQQQDPDETLSSSCSICLGTLVDGERVGVLPCDHLFHVSCLKPWLKRKNTCPLCQRQDVAEARCPTQEPSSSNDETEATSQDNDQQEENQ